MKTIEITVSRDGTTRVETKGFHGAECQAASRLLEIATGQRKTEELTMEFHNAACTNSHVSEAN